MKNLTDYISSTKDYVSKGAKYGALGLTIAATAFAANPLANKIDLTNLYKSSNDIVKVGSNPGEQAKAKKSKLSGSDKIGLVFFGGYVVYNVSGKARKGPKGSL